MYVDNGTTVNLMPKTYYEQATFLHHLPKYDGTGEIIRTGCVSNPSVSVSVSVQLAMEKLLGC